MIRSAIAAAATLLVGGVGMWLYAQHWHPSERAYPFQGIDVSRYQGSIDWRGLTHQGVDFAYIKATEGGDLRDSQFASNWRSAGAVGIARGAYHFFTLCRSGADQAANFLAAVPGDRDALPPAVDLEFGGNCSYRPPREQLLRELGTFLQRIEARSGKPALLYLTSEFDDAYRISEVIDRPLWLRSLYFEPQFGARHWTLWQASNLRQLRGIEGRVDWNAARLDLARIAPAFGNQGRAENPR